MIQSPLSTCVSLPSVHIPQIHWPTFGPVSQPASIFTPGPLHMLFLLNTFPFSLFSTTLLPLIVLLDYICLAPPSSCCKAFLIFFFVSCTTHHSLQFNFSVYTFFFWLLSLSGRKCVERQSLSCFCSSYYLHCPA